jgi:exonuclease III
MGPPDRDHIRIGSINLNNMLQNASGDERLFRSIYERDIDILCMQEVGCNWSNIPRELSLQSRLNKTFGPHDTRSCVKYNVHDLGGTRTQWGGTGIISRGKIKHFTLGVGGDPTGLGRWTWARYRGKGGMILRVVTIYCPCLNREGPLSVWTQHKTFLQMSNDDREPRKAFLEDLENNIQEWIQGGDQVLVCGDLNHNILSRKITTLFQSHNMSNLIFRKHGSLNAPSTYYKDAEGKSVDGMWGTPGLIATRGGYLRPEVFPGNHSLLWVDISYQSALGHNPPRPINPEARRLRLWDKRCVARYLDSYQKQIDHHRLPQRQFRLEQSTRWGIPLTDAQAQEAEAIDTLKTKCSNRADRHCRKLKKGEVEFSEATIVPIRLIVWWNIAIRRRQGKKVQPSLWVRRKHEAGLADLRTADMSLALMYQKRSEAVRAYRQAKKNHEAHRTDHIKKMPIKIRERLLRVEKQRKLAHIAKKINGKLANKSIFRLEHNNVELTTQASIERVLLAVNEAKVRASDHTPFMQAPLLQDFGYRDNMPAHEQVLQGTYTPPACCAPATKILLQGLSRADPNPQQSSFTPRRYISTEDHIRSWKKKREQTTGGMSGIHCGHYKAHLLRRRLAALDASQRSVAYTTGFTFSRWKKGRDVQLLKKTNDHNATNLRTILLLEPDFNMNNKMIGDDAMRAGERQRTHARDNYGGRKGLQAPEVSMNQLLTYNSIWGRRGKAIIMSNDAKGCYDRIAHTVVSLALQRLGIPRPAVLSMLGAIQEMEHFVRTAFGDSAETYGNDPTRPPPQGILQGNGAGPAGWAAISAIIIQAMRDQGFGLTEWSLIRKRAINLVCFAFVDDTDLIHSKDRSFPNPQFLQQAQNALNLWEGLLHATGGALAPEKSYWYWVEVTRVRGKWGYAKIRQRPGSLSLRQGTIPNTRLEVNQAKKALGIMIRPDGNMKDEVKLLLQAAVS